MTVNAAIIISLITLILLVIAHTVVISRWSGKVDASLAALLNQRSVWTADLTATATALRTEHNGALGALRGELSIYIKETEALRAARHIADGKLQLQEGKFLAHDRAIDRLEKWLEECERERRAAT